MDGLQRTTALLRYTDQPLLYAPAEELIPPDFLQDLALLLREAGAQHHNLSDLIMTTIRMWMRDTRTVLIADGYEPRTLADTLATHLDLNGDDIDPKAFTELVGPFLDQLRSAIDIHDVELPVIVYSGSAGNLPNIFELINSRGTKLSKYDIYAATWIDQETAVRNSKIRDAIDAKYQEILDQGYEISGLSATGITDYSLFEYLFGLGKELSSRHPELFGAPTEATDTQPIAFTLATVAHRLRLSEMSKLPQRFSRDHTGLVIPEAFEEALFESVGFVAKCLQPYIGLRLNRRSTVPMVVHTEYQIASLVLRALIARWEPLAWSERGDWESERNTLKEAFPHYYLHDIIQQNWRGSGDSRLFDMVWRSPSDDQPNILNPSPHYITPITEQQWDDVLDTWHSEQLQRQQRTRPHVRHVERAFLKFVYASVVSHLDEHQKEFDLEHLFPVARLRDEIAEEDEGWPISAVSNLALFEQSLNREKTKQTIKEWLEDAANTAARDDVERYVLVDPEAVHIPNGGLKKSDYTNFLEQRFVVMKRLLMENLPSFSSS